MYVLLAPVYVSNNRGDTLVKYRTVALGDSQQQLQAALLLLHGSIYS